MKNYYKLQIKVTTAHIQKNKRAKDANLGSEVCYKKEELAWMGLISASRQVIQRDICQSSKQNNFISPINLVAMIVLK